MFQKVLATGFELKPEFRVTFNSQLYDVMEEAPYDANAFAYFKRDKDQISGLLIIASSEGQFVANCADEDIDALGKKLFRKIRVQLRDWRTRRLESAGYAARH
jgi:hypothetical protein